MARVIGTPGASAHREHQRRRQRERDAALQRVPLKLGLVIGSGVVGYLAVQIFAAVVNHASKPHVAVITKPAFSPSEAHGIGVLVALVACIGMARLIWGHRQTTESWGTGGAGEDKVGATLISLAPRGVISIHDRRIPGSRANIDHIAVTASGVYVIDAKVVKGRMSARRNGPIWNRGPAHLFIGSRDKTSFVTGMERQMKAVASALNGCPATIPIRASVVLVGVQVGLFERPLAVEGVWVGWRKELAKVLVKPGPISLAQRHQIADAIANRLPPA